MECLLYGARLQAADNTVVEACIGGIRRYGIGCYRCTTSRLGVVETFLSYDGDGSDTGAPAPDYDDEGRLVV